jgi:hypothetical protein
LLYAVLHPLVEQFLFICCEADVGQVDGAGVERSLWVAILAFVMLCGSLFVGCPVFCSICCSISPSLLAGCYQLLRR